MNQEVTMNFFYEDLENIMHCNMARRVCDATGGCGRIRNADG